MHDIEKKLANISSGVVFPQVRKFRITKRVEFLSFYSQETCNILDGLAGRCNVDFKGSKRS